MSEPARFAVSLLAIAVFVLILHWIAGRLAPRSAGDPRLGTVGFWVWVILTAAFVHFVVEGLDLEPRLRIKLPDTVGWAIVVVCLGYSVAERLGWVHARTWFEQSQANHEEAWATAVGLIIALAVPLFVRHVLH